MLKKTIVSFFYFLHYYSNDAFIPPSFHIKNNNLCRLLESNNNDFETKPSNKNIRLGRSKDQDGKGNIWSVEPTMEIVDEEMTELNKNILTSGLIITGFLATLPLLYSLNQYIQNIDY